MSYNKLRSIFIDNIIFLDYYKGRDLKLRWPVFLHKKQNSRGELVIPLLKRLIITSENEIAGFIDFTGRSDWYVLKPRPNKESLLYFKIHEDDTVLWDNIIDVTVRTLKQDWNICLDTVNILGKEKL